MNTESIFKGRRMIAQHCRHRNQSDIGAASIITSMLLLPIMFFVIISAIDMGLYFNSQALVENAASDASRTTVLYGGAGTASHHSDRELQYGTQVTHSQLSEMGDNVGVNVSNSVEYELVNDLLGKETALFRLVSVECGPNSLGKVGEVAYCDVEWGYDGLPVSAWGMMVSNNDIQTSTGNAQSQSTHDEITTIDRVV